MIRAYDATTGNLICQDIGESQGLFDSAVEHQGRVVAIGAIGEDPSPTPGSAFFFRSDWLVQTYDAATGELLWVDRLGRLMLLGMSRTIVL